MNAAVDSFYRHQLKQHLLAFYMLLVAVLTPGVILAQVSTGSDGSDHSFTPTSSTNVDMSLRADGIYQFTSVNIPTGVNVTFTPNANNTPVVWLVQGDVVINGTVVLDGESEFNQGVMPGQGGPGGWAGGYGGQGSAPLPQRGHGLGGGDAGSDAALNGGHGSYATTGDTSLDWAIPGPAYGNKYLLPLLGGSGGGGCFPGSQYASLGGAGGGGAILIASDSSVKHNGPINANGRSSAGGGAGSGGSIRLLAPRIEGTGSINAMPGSNNHGGYGGLGYVRIDALDDEFVGTLNGSASRGFNSILIAPSPGVTLAIQSIGATPVSATPTGVVSTPDAILSAQQNNPIPVVVKCVNLPLNTAVSVSVQPVNGPTITATGLNNTGTQAYSTATVTLNLPRGGGRIYATAAIAN